MATEIAAKGDLIAGTGSATFDNLTVGANNLVLTADSSTTTGLKWAAPDPLTTKGDLFTYSTTEARLAVGNDGETLVADSSATTGLRYQANFAAGKNKVINGDVGIWQRGTSFNPAASGYFFTADRFAAYNYGTSATTVTQQTFTPGTAPVAGYEGQYFLRINSTNTRAYVETRLEDVRTFAGQTVTLSFWAKSASGQSSEQMTISQNFGSGGSSGTLTGVITPSITTSWTRFSATVSIPSVSGKTIGTGSYLSIEFRGNINNALDLWGFQLEASNTATAFQTATGTIQGELAACQRYYYRESYSTTLMAAPVIASASTLADFIWQYPVAMRIAPTLSSSSATNDFLINTAASGSLYYSSIAFLNVGVQRGQGRVTVSGYTAGQAGFILLNQSGAFLQASAEL
jgi:hypothetical protein